MTRTPLPWMIARWTSMIVAVTLVAAGALVASTGQSADATVWDGIFTEEQAARGRNAYEQECAACHLDDLLGDGIAPALTGTAFDFRWSDLAVGDMFASIRATMPQGAPASLSMQGYVDIVSYLLQANDYPAGDAELPGDEAVLNGIIITAEQETGSSDGGNTVWNGVFTEEQAARGKNTYEQECAACHLDDLLGDGMAPALAGTAFDFRWSDLAVGDMLAAIRATMPQGAPASLSAQAYVDIVSYVLQANDFPAGDEELPTDEATLNEIIIVSEQP